MSQNIQPPPAPRSRWLYGFMTLAVIAIGLSWRSSWLGLSPWLMKYGGDALWATAIMVTLTVIWPRAGTRTLALAAFLIASAIESSQLCHAPWLESVRAVPLGALLLGTTFHWPDFLAYAVGVCLGMMLDWGGRWQDQRAGSAPKADPD